VIQIREERDGDAAAIRELNRLAFGQDQESNIVDALRANGAVILSLVATMADRVVGHILYSPVTVNENEGAGLAPMAVSPDHQRQGIGSKLVEAGARRLAQSGCPFIVVVGHPTFYPRFGFEPASRHRLTSEWELPDDVFMVLVLDSMKMAGVSGEARYRTEFSSVV
jgi:putative acetyltransferase